MPLRPGETFGRYQLAEALGQGAMGEVYSAYDTVLHRKVALKVLTAGPSAFAGAGPPSTKGAARILREARAAAGITHPNAVAIYDVGEVDGVPFLAMELVSGRTLRAFIGDPSIALGRRIRWVIDVALALGAAHQLGLIHRDIKPENVMVRDDGFVKVLDFGIARRTGAEREPDAERPPAAATDLEAISRFALTNGTLTQDGVVVGTPMYMAPEQLRGEALDGRMDQFAWGVLACELLTGKLPWEGEGIAVLSQILSQEVGSLSTRFPEIPARVDAVIRKTLSKPPGNRFAAMEEIAADLEPYAVSAGGVARADERGTPLRDAAAVAPTEQVQVPSGAIAQTGGIARTQPGAGPARRRGRTGTISAAVIAAVVVGGLAGVRLLALRPPAHAVPDAAPASEPPSQLSTNPDATAAYRAGMQALRDASLGSALKQLGHAVELDPMFALAHLRLSLARLVDSSQVTTADLQPARDSRASLGERDRSLLDAIEPCGLDPPDLAESQRRLEAAVRKYPTDADLAFQLAVVLDNSGQPAKALAQLDSVVALDPTLALAWMVKGEVRVEVGDVPGAFEAYAECVKISPGATSCLSDTATVQANEGKCEELVATSRKLITLAPTSPWPYQRLAEGLVGSGESFDAVRAALRQRWDREPASRRHVSELAGEAALAVLAGDFPGASRRYEELEKLTATEADDPTRFGLAYPRMLVDLETGRAAQAIQRAALYVRQRTAWSGSVHDNSLAAYAIELGAGGIRRSAFDAIRDRWLAQNKDEQPGLRWVDAYAIPAETPEDARAAVAAKPDGPLVNSLLMAPSVAEPIGRTFFLAGKLDEAIRFLSAASAACAVIDGTAGVFSTWAAFDLGRALEARGDAAGACSAYQRVIARWGSASPPARTATKAKERRTALACGP